MEPQVEDRRAVRKAVDERIEGQGARRQEIEERRDRDFAEGGGAIVNAVETKSQMLSLLHSGIERGGFETDDVLAIVLPLLRQTLELHEKGLVAPLENYEKVKIAENKLCFEAGTGLAPKKNPESLEKLQLPE